jgi:hypothetical protein
MNLPPNYTNYQEKINPFAFLDVNLIPFNCLAEVTFHDRLKMVTLVPIVFLLYVFLVYGIMHIALVKKNRYDRIPIMRSQAVYIAVLSLYSAFPLVSAVIFQMVSYNQPLEGKEYLKADYSVEKNDPAHQSHVLYAAVMGFVYMVGIPLSSYLLLRARKEPIKKLQKIEQRILQCSHRDKAKKASLYREKVETMEENPYLEGLSPLYRDYEPEFWWWEIPRFYCTVILCGLVTVTNLEDGSQIAASLMVSTTFLVTYANCNPYLMRTDDQLAQLCQVCLCLAMVVGLLEKANAAGESANDVKGSSWFGYTLIASVTLNLALGFGAVLLAFLETFFPRVTEKFHYYSNGLPARGTTKNAAATPPQTNKKTFSRKTSFRNNSVASLDKTMNVEHTPVETMHSSEGLISSAGVVTQKAVANDSQSKDTAARKPAVVRKSTARRCEF